MRSRSNLLVLLGIAFFVVGGVIVYLITTDDDDGGAEAAATGRRSSSPPPTSPPASLADDLIAENKLRTEEIDAGPARGRRDRQPQPARRAPPSPRASQADQQITSAGVQLQPTRTFTIPEGFDAVAVQLDFVPGVAGYVSPGDRINLYGTVAGSPRRAACSPTSRCSTSTSRSRPAGAPPPIRTPSGTAPSVHRRRHLPARPAPRRRREGRLPHRVRRASTPRSSPTSRRPPGPPRARTPSTIFEEEPNDAFNG